MSTVGFWAFMLAAFDFVALWIGRASLVLFAMMLVALVAAGVGGWVTANLAEGIDDEC